MGRSNKNKSIRSKIQRFKVYQKSDAFKEKLKTSSDVHITKPQRSRRHKKLKAVDPFNVVERPLNKKERQINQRPTDESDYQGMTAKQREIIQLNEKVMTLPSRRQRKKLAIQREKNESKIREHGMKKFERPTPRFVQGKRESEQQFLERVERDTKKVLLQSRFEDKYKIKTKVKLNEKNKLQETHEKKKKSKSTKRHLKELNEQKKNKKVNNSEKGKSGFEHLKDEIEFGEVAMQPPTIVSKSIIGTSSTSNSGSKKSLLLHKIISSEQSDLSHGNKPSRPRKIGQTIPRKDMTFSKQRQFDIEQQRAIKLYKEQKKLHRKTLSKCHN